MNNNQVDITKLSVTEIKALAFDVRNQLEIAQNNWNLINGELQRRAKEQESKLVTPTEVVPPQ